MRNANINKFATYKWASPEGIKPKHEKSICICIDYRNLDAVTIHDEYSFPRMDESNDYLMDAKAFSALEAIWGFR